MLLQIQVDLEHGARTNAGYAIPFIESVLKQLKEDISPDLDFITDVIDVKNNDSAVICESADTRPGDGQLNPTGQAQQVTLRISVERAEFDTTVRSYVEAGEEGTFEKEVRFGAIR